jgi:leucyl/phenylalanyl-tRNA--protein transferase
VRARIHGALDEIPAAAWDALHDGRNPFVAHAFLAGMEAHDCVRASLGWMPHHLALYDGETLVAAAPGYRKRNSHGEFVFDHAWAQAYAHHGLPYYPKWLGAVPYSPVTGPRLLARNHATRRALVEAIVAMTRDAGWSSAHVNFHDAQDDAAFGPEWIARTDVQYHWENRAGWRDFREFLLAMEGKRRKNIRQEREKLARLGVTYRIVHGAEASEADLAAMHGFYLQTFHEYGNTPALTLDFLRHLARTMPRALVLILADLGGETIAGALCLRGGATLFGRYWGATRLLSGLHFETCYYQGIEYCLREGLSRFEPGAQGEHKLARGFLPTRVRSRHWIAQPDFAEAIRHWCEEETVSVERYLAALSAHSPFRDDPEPAMPVRLGPEPVFPPAEHALREPNGLLAVGGDLSVPRLLEAYRRGIFPWFSEGQPALWWSPDPRMVFDTDGGVRLSSRFRRTLRSSDWVVRADTRFADVIAACASTPRPGQRGTWIVPAMQRAYLALHRQGHAHSIEVFDGDRLVGGLYGVAVGAMFFAESMFSAESGGSKVALAALAHRLKAWGWPLIDAQVENDHLVRMGATTMPRDEFLRHVARQVAVDEAPGAWTARFGELNAADLTG